MFQIESNFFTVYLGDEWKAMRALVTPIFTSGRMKTMVPIMNKICEDLKTFSGELAKESHEIDTKELFSSAAFEIIMSTGFGVDVNAWNDKDNIFKKMAWTYLGYIGDTKKLMIKFILAFFFPQITAKLKIRVFDEESEDFLANVMKQTLEQRRSGNAPKRNDLVDLFIQAMENAENVEDASGSNSTAAILAKMSDEKKEIAIVSQALIIFLAGFDTTSTALSLTFHFLATNPDCQDKLLEEINAAVDDNDGKEDLSYDQITKLEYTEAVLHESMRLYNFVGALERLCTKDYPIPDMNYTIPKGMIVQVANFQNDDEFFSNANKFNPENFLEESKQNRSPYAYSTFGHGPRNCVGMRFALMQMKLILVHMVRNFKILECEKTPKELDPDPMHTSQLPKGGLWVKLEARV